MTQFLDKTLLSVQSTESQEDALSKSLLNFHCRFPNFFDNTMISEKEWIFSKIDPLYLSIRSDKHLGRMVRSLHVIHRQVTQDASFEPSDRHLYLSVFPANLSFPFMQKEVIGVSLGINLLSQHERFDFKHIQSALKACCPELSIVFNSLFVFKNANCIQSFYFEIEAISTDLIDIAKFRLKLPLFKSELKKRVESLVPELFMPRNEEEIMRTIFALSKEMTEPDDIPQIAVSLQSYKQSELCFSAIVLRVLKEGCPEIQEDRFSSDDYLVEIERNQIVKYLDHSTPIEMFLISIQFHDLSYFERADFSIHIPDARKKVLNILETCLGDVRDFNGGLLQKQTQAFEQLKRLLPGFSRKHPDILEAFFYSISPIEYQATLQTEVLVTWLTLISEHLEKNHSKEAKLITISGEKWDYLLIRSPNREILKALKQEQKKFPHLFSNCASTSLIYENRLYLTFLAPKPHALQPFLNDFVHHWNMSKTTIRPFSIHALKGLSLDPRIGGDSQSSTLLRMLFEGLLRKDAHGQIHPAIAKTYKVSEDQKHYTFYLKHTFWSNGETLKASDFEYSWKKVLDPHFETPFAYLFDPILSAKKAKKGLCSIEKVGIRAVDSFTLEVELEFPCTYFLETLAHSIFYPVNRKQDLQHPDWPRCQGENYICNGPYKLTESRPFYAFELLVNKQYWNHENVQIPHVVISNSNRKVAFKLFEEGKIDWLGSPMSYWETDSSSSKYLPLTSPSPRILWLSLNTILEPFNCPLLRKSLAYALKRDELFSSQIYAHEPAFSPLPKHHSLITKSKSKYFENETLARKFFKESMEEANFSQNEMPQLKLTVPDSELMFKIASSLISQWKKVLDLKVAIEVYPFQHLFHNLTTGQYQLGMIRWTAWINDPLYTLNPFAFRDDKVNFSNWENPEYRNKILKAQNTTDSEKKNKFLQEAEEILIDSCAIIPIFYEPEFFLKNPRVVIPLPKNEGGIVDFSYAKLEGDL